MANEIKDKFAASTAFTISLAGVADGAGRQSTMINNETTRFQDVLVFVKVTTGTSPDGDSTIGVYAIRGDDHTANIRSDNAGASDAALTVLNAELLGVIRTDSGGTNDTAYYGVFLFHRPGPGYGIAVVNNTGAALHATGGNHVARYVGLNPEVQ